MLVDVDGVLADFIGGILPIINAVLGAQHIREDITEFSFADALKMTPEQATKVKREIGRSPRLAGWLDVCPGAIDGMRQLREVADVWIVTSPWNSNETWCHDREQWLERNFDIHHSQVIHTNNKQLVSGDMLVDDKTSTCEAWQAAWPDRKAVLWATPHNRRDIWNGLTTSSWNVVVELARSVTP